MTAKKKKRKETYNFSFNKKLTNRGSASSFLIQKESYCEPISSHCLLNPITHRKFRKNIHLLANI
jgi:hypothetical protein